MTTTHDPADAYAADHSYGGPQLRLVSGDDMRMFLAEAFRAGQEHERNRCHDCNASPVQLNELQQCKPCEEKETARHREKAAKLRHQGNPT